MFDKVDLDNFDEQSCDITPDNTMDPDLSCIIVETDEVFNPETSFTDFETGLNSANESDTTDGIPIGGITHDDPNDCNNNLILSLIITDKMEIMLE